MSDPVVVIGAGMGGLSAALRLARAGITVTVLEARATHGGLASGVHFGGLDFDAGPYILLDRPGLEWACERLGLDLAAELPLLPINDVYCVEFLDGTRVHFYADLAKTAAGFDQLWPGSGKRYSDFVRKLDRISRSLRPMLELSRPTPLSLIRTGGWMHASFLLKPLAGVLAESKLPAALLEAMAIWTHVAGQTTAEAPSPLAFVPALMHSVGSYFPRDGMRRIPQVLESAARKAGVRFEYNTLVTRIRSRDGKAIGVETSTGDFIPARAVLSNAAALGTYLHLLDTLPHTEVARLKKLPLQSPGVCAYLAVRGHVSPPYLQFKLGHRNEQCRLFIRAGLMDRQRSDGWIPARLLAPMKYAEAERAGLAGQLAYLDQLLEEAWWRQGFWDVQVLAKRTAQDWGSEYNLYANSMNPVMTARFMRAGRMAHRSPYLRGLYLAGSSTHPGQWVSFCAISGVLAADCLIEDLH